MTTTFVVAVLVLVYRVVDVWIVLVGASVVVGETEPQLGVS